MKYSLHDFQLQSCEPDGRILKCELRSIEHLQEYNAEEYNPKTDLVLRVVVDDSVPPYYTGSWMFSRYIFDWKVRWEERPNGNLSDAEDERFNGNLSDLEMAQIDEYLQRLRKIRALL
jgi:hypothetical protein